MLYKILILLVLASTTWADEFSKESSSNTLRAEIPATLGFLTHIKSEILIEEFFDQLEVELNLQYPIDYQIHPVSSEQFEGNFIELRAGKLNSVELAMTEDLFKKKVIYYGLMKEGEKSYPGRWRVLKTITNPNPLELVKIPSKQILPSEQKIRFKNGIEAQVSNRLKLFVNANEEWRVPLIDTSLANKVIKFDSKKLEPVNGHTEIGLRESSRTYSIRNIFLLQPNSEFGLKSPPDVSIYYQGIYLYFSQEF